MAIIFCLCNMLGFFILININFILSSPEKTLFVTKEYSGAMDDNGNTKPKILVNVQVDVKADGLHLSSLKSHGTCFTKDCISASHRLFKHMDFSVDPCEDFNKFACGNFSTPMMSRPIINVDLIVYSA